MLDVIPFNPWAGSEFREPSADVVAAFVARLRARGCLVKVRRTRGRDARAACGTLAA
jgi:23S rRNA (adenine2503-C2)-methyltransferase